MVEDRQREYIANNLDRLVRNTYCSAQFLSSLTADGIITKADVELLMECRRSSGSNAESLLFYKTCMKQEKDFYENLIKALQETKQEEASEVLMDWYRN